MPQERKVRFRRLSRLGEGGTGRVWLVEDHLRPGQLLALKELAIDSTEAAIRLRGEFALLATLQHPNLVEVHDFEIPAGGGHPRFTLEYIDGGDLVSAAREEGPACLLGFAVEALRALAFLHDFGLIHRDLKPANVLVRKQPRSGSRVVLLDFGLAIGREDRQSVALSGTLPYLAPELLGGAAPSRRSDLYGLGAVLFEALWGHTPHAFVPGDVAAFLKEVRDNAVTLPAAPVGCPEGLCSWIGQLLVVEPSDRPSSASEALARLNAACGTAHVLENAATRAARLRSGPPPGRDQEVERLWNSLTPEAGPRVVLLAGAVGTGKTRLLRWIEAEAVRRGWQVWSRPLDAADGEPPARLAESVLSEVRAATARSPCLVLIDEVESPTPAVMEFLRRASQDVAAEPVQVIAALRPEDVRHPPLQRMLGDAGLVETLARVDLGPLDETAIGEVFTRATGGDKASSAQTTGLREASDGSPLILEALLIGGDEGRGAAAGGARALESSIGNRVLSLPRDAREWLLAIAIAGPEAEESLLVELSALRADAAREAAGATARAGLAHAAGGRWSLASRLVGQHVRSHCDPERLRLLHEKTAEQLASSPATSRDCARLATLWKGAGRRDESIECALAAAGHLSALREHAEAATWIRFALAQLARRDARRKEMRMAHVQVLQDEGQQLQAARGLATVSRLEPDVVQRAALKALQAVALAKARRTRAATVLAARVLESGQEHGSLRVEVLASYALALVAGVEGRFTDAVRLLAPEVERLATIGEPRLRAEALMALGYAESCLRQDDLAREHLTLALESSRREGAARTEAQIRLALAVLEYHTLDLQRALKSHTEARLFARENRFLREYVTAVNNETAVLLDSGRFDLALRLVREAEPTALYVGWDSGFLQCRLHRADALVALGRPVEAVALISALLDAPRPGFERIQLEFARVTLADALLETDSPSDSRIGDLTASALAKEGWSFKLTLGALVVELERCARHESEGSFDEAWTRFDQFRARAPTELEPWAVIRAQIARSRVQARRGELADAATLAGGAAEVAISRGLPWLGARAFSLLGEVHESAGRAAEAREAFARGRELLDAAAQRIEDEELRQDFLARPVHARLRESARAGTASDDRVLALYRMIHALNSEDDPELLLESMLDMALEVVGAERGLVLLREPGAADEFRVRVARNLEQQTIRDATEFSVGVVREAGGGRAVLSVDAGHDERLREFKSVSVFGIRSVICVPLRSRGQVTGAVYVDNRKHGALFDAADLRFLEAFADHAALALANARARQRLEYENRRLQVAADARVEFAHMIGRSAPMQRVFDLVERVAETSLPVLIHGESGTGKELVAQAIHAHGARKRKRFLSENCAAIPETLLESELFGHVKGAFTGADRERKGLFAQADGGTLFLDEVGDMSAAMQARLLRVLQEGEVRPVGGERTLRVDVRIVAATHRDLAAEVAAGRFREDLLYRMQVLLIELPALRERVGDVPLLVEHFLRGIGAARGRGAPVVRSAVLDLLERYAWPGNVRQLESTLQRLALLAGDGPVTLEVVQSDAGLAAMLLGERPRDAPVYSLEQHEREQIRAALASAAGNRARAAKLLGISRATIFRKIREYGLA